jgi:N-acetylglucosaminyl-diphospho-decaprenol L-rhamnosyltransferase
VPDSAPDPVATPENSPSSPGVDAVVVNYNAGTLLPDCVASLKADGVDAVVVVDNGSTDGSGAIQTVHDDVTWLEAGDNLGYGRAANLGARACSGEYLLVCNPDLVVRPGTVKSLVAALADDPGNAIAGPKLINPDGSLYPSARVFPSIVDAVGHGLLGLVWQSNPFSRRYRLLDWDHAQARPVDWVSGACFLIRRQAWDRLSGFDPSFFMYMEDVDLCWRARREGWRVVYEPAGEVVHVQGSSTDQRPYRMMVHHHRSLWRFAVRSTTGWRRTLLPAVWIGLLARAVIACGTKWTGRRAAALRPAGPEHPRNRQTSALH